MIGQLCSGCGRKLRLDESGLCLECWLEGRTRKKIFSSAPQKYRFEIICRICHRAFSEMGFSLHLVRRKLLFVGGEDRTGKYLFVKEVS